MSRVPVSLRQASVMDAPFLADLWSEFLRRVDRQDQVADLELVLKAASQSAEQRVVICEYDGEPAGAVYLSVSTMSPINLEPVVQALWPMVAPQFRRKGVGRTLMDAAVGYAEELGIGHIATAAASSSRDGNRFLARLAFGPQAVLRAAATPAVRAKLTAMSPARDRTSGRRQVLAARRSMRRHTTLG